MEDEENHATEAETEEIGDRMSIASDDYWKDTLRAAFENALAEMDQEEGEAAAVAIRESTNPDNANDDPADLYSFYEELVALRGEQRAGNRKTANAFTQFSQVLGALEQRLTEMQESVPDRQGSSESSDVPERFCVALAIVYDRIGRIRESFARPPKAPLFGGATWLSAWQSMDEAVGMLHGHLEELLSDAGMEKIPTANRAFDPALMRAVAVRAEADDCPANTVYREIASGWLKNGRVISPAEVEICKPL